jgi:hypothetical protein
MMAQPPVIFPLGKTVATEGAVEILTHEEMVGLIRRHAANDWGEVSMSDAIMNEDALKCGDRIVSVYVMKGEKFYVITEHDRSRTTLMVANEY